MAAVPFNNQLGKCYYAMHDNPNFYAVKDPRLPQMYFRIADMSGQTVYTDAAAGMPCILLKFRVMFLPGVYPNRVMKAAACSILTMTNQLKRAEIRYRD
jgi:hypothetical protein